MSIASEITRVGGAVQAAFAALEEKGVIIQDSEKVVSNLANKIASIPSGVKGHTLHMVGVQCDDSSELQCGFAILADGTYEVFHSESSTIENVVAVLIGLNGSGGRFDFIGGDYVSNRRNIKTYVLTEDTTINFNAVADSCFIEGTRITLADGSEKPVEEISYEDDLKVWDFDEGRTACSRPLWIKKNEINGYRFVNEFESGRVLETTGRSNDGWGHRGFNFTRKSFTYFPSSVGDMFVMEDGSLDRLVSSRYVKVSSCYYNAITERHMNLYANGILTSCSLNNGMYQFDADKMMFIKGNRDSGRVRSIEEFNVPEKYYVGLRLGEQNGSSAKINDYVGNLIRRAK